MKKGLVYSFLLAAFVCAAYKSYASCMLGTAFCSDDSGTSVAGIIYNGNGAGTPSLTKAQMNLATPNAKGQKIFCSDCQRSYICVSSATTVGSYTVTAETGTMATPTHCQ
jgi:hypothetical protein